jgi:hypothetical protein
VIFSLFRVLLGSCYLTSHKECYLVLKARQATALEGEPPSASSSRIEHIRRPIKTINN